MRLDTPFNLDDTLCCGQVFRWEKQGEWWCGVVGDRFLKLRLTDKKLEFEGNVDREFVHQYLSLDHDLQRISREIGIDTHIRAALRKYWGLRIIRQDPWECLISFICATYKSVAAIKQMINRLSMEFGEQRVFEGCSYYSFPSPEKLASATLVDLGGCGLGYRSKYIQETAKKIQNSDYNLETLKNMTYEQAKKELHQLPGVGSKVADCILLFSLGKLEAFPVDLWVKRIILRHYADHFPDSFVKKLTNRESFSNSEYDRINAFGREYFGKNAGYAQEYLYHYERINR